MGVLEVVNITIQERAFAFRSEYDISTPDRNYYARKKLFSIRAKVELMTGEDRVVATIRSLSFFRSRYDFELSDGNVYRFRCEKFWKGVYACEGNEERYHLYQHKGLRYSIFQDDRQIAAITKNRLVVGKGNRYEIQLNDDANVAIVICLALTINTSQDDDDHSTVTIDFGNIGPEDRKFDESWEPS